MESFSKKGVVVFSFLIISASLTAQKKILMGIDSVLIEQNHYLADYDYQNFFENEFIDQHIDPENIDYELAAACIFFSINQWREKRRKSPYRKNSKLDRIGFLYAQHYGKYRFRNHSKGYYKLKRTLKKVPLYSSLDFSYLDGYMNLPVVVDYKRGPVYYSEVHGTSENKLYFGRFSKDEDFVEEPVPSLTYRQFGERMLSNLLKSKSGTLLRSKAYDLMAVKVAPIKKRRGEKVIPRVKVIYLIGGYRMKFVSKSK